MHNLLNQNLVTASFGRDSDVGFFKDKIQMNVKQNSNKIEKEP
jgi:hypothetical protein